MYFSSTKAVLPSVVISSRHLFSSATVMAASAPDVLQGFGLTILGFISDIFFHVRVLCEILDLVDHLQSLLWIVC